MLQLNLWEIIKTQREVAIVLGHCVSNDYFIQKNKTN